MPVLIHADGKAIPVRPADGRSVLELAGEAGRHLDAKCGGKGSCGACSVWLGEGRYRIFGVETVVPRGERREALACQTLVEGDDAEIFIPHASLIPLDDARIVDDLSLPPHRRDPVADAGFGLAVDIGTTTVVAALVDLASGKIVRRESLYNQQILKADDVVSRISLCENPAQLDLLRELVVEHTLNPLLTRLRARTKLAKSDVVHAVLSGNTVMMHLLFGVSPAPIGVSPFVPPFRTFRRTAKEVGLDLPPDAVVETIPAIAGYVGGDVVSDLLVSGLLDRPGLSLLVDVGTNGEMVAHLDGRTVACATAAGPAFEGAGLLHGMRAAARAVEAVRCAADLDLRCRVIGNDPPIGLCGTGVIDFVAEGFRHGFINAVGRYDVERLKRAGRYASVSGMHACILVPEAESGLDGPVVVTERDVAEILKAKAAVYAGIKTLLAHLGKTVHDLDRVILAGGFARHIDLPNAAVLGLLPELPEEKYEIVGNASLAGAVLALLDRATLPAAEALVDRPEILSLNQTPWFVGYFQEALAIPNLDEEEFPNVLRNVSEE